MTEIEFFSAKVSGVDFSISSLKRFSSRSECIYDVENLFKEWLSRHSFYSVIDEYLSDRFFYVHQFVLKDDTGHFTLASIFVESHSFHIV